jgi:hypothetical protein
MSLSKRNITLADLIRPKVSAPEKIGTEVSFNTGPEAYAAVFEENGITVETAQKVLELDKRFITSLTFIGGELAEEQFKADDEVEAISLSAAIDDNHVHTVRIQKVHEPVEGKPQYGLVQVHSAFRMDTDTSEEFKKVSRAISKNVRAIAAG